MGILGELGNIGKKLGILEEVNVPQTNIPQSTPIAPPTSNTSSQTLVATTPQPATLQPTAIQPIVVMLSSDDGEYSTILQESLKSASTSGMDFYKFLKSVEALSKTIPDENSRYQTAFLVASTTANTTVDELLTSSNKFFEVLEAEKKEFTNEWVASHQAEIAQIDNEINTINSELDQISQQIDELINKKNGLMASRDEKSQQVLVINANIEVETRNFDSASYKEKIKLDNHKSNIEKYLKPKEQV